MRHEQILDCEPGHILLLLFDPNELSTWLLNLTVSGTIM